MTIEPTPNKGPDYFFDAQLRRLHQQFTALFYNRKYKAIDQDGNLKEYKIIAKPAIRDRQVAHILRSNSENTQNFAPGIYTSIQDLQYNPNYQQDPFFVHKQYVQEVQFDEATGRYLNQPGPDYSVERYMSAPFLVTMRVDIWTTNELQKQMVLEQLLPLKVPSLDLYTSENWLHWSALQVMRLTNIQYSSRTVPIGSADDELDIATLTFEIPTWIDLPSKLTRRQIIEDVKITAKSLIEPDFTEEEYEQAEEDAQDFLLRIPISPVENQIHVQDNVVTLLSCSANELDEKNNMFSWNDLFYKIKHKFRPGVSKLEINLDDDPESRKNIISGNLDYHTESNKLLWTIDPMTLPLNTLDPVDSYIDPSKKSPGVGLPLSPPLGTRYIISKDQGPSEAWGQKLNAKANDIIQFTESGWRVAWTAQAADSVEIIFNKKQKKQFIWTGEQWIYLYEGTYRAGWWRLKM